MSSRIVALTKACGIGRRGFLLNKKAVGLVLKQQTRQSGTHDMTYRSVPKEDYAVNWMYAKWVNGFMWWWILWHFFTEYEELIGFTMPNSSDWTDKELGIPED